jgi:hypothetical protein
VRANSAIIPHNTAKEARSMTDETKKDQPTVCRSTLFPFDPPSKCTPDSKKHKYETTPEEKALHDAMVKRMDLDGKPKNYQGDYNQHLLEQYKVAVQMADKISDRRSLANTYFMSINSTTIVVGAVITGYLNVLGATLWVYLIATVGLFLTYFWYRIVESYKQLNSGKFKVIHNIETRLPTSIFDGEWEILARGKDYAVYRPLTETELMIPMLFARFYLVIAILMTVYLIYTIIFGGWDQPFPVHVAPSMPSVVRP